MVYRFGKSLVLIASENWQAKKINRLARCVHTVAQRWAAVSQTAATSGSTRRRMRSALKPIRRGGRPWRITTWKPPAGTVRHRTADPGAEIFCQIMVICYHALALGFFRRVSGYLGGI